MASARPPQLDDRFAALGKHRRAPGVRRGAFDFLELGVINQGLLPSHLEFCGGCSALGRRPERQLRAAAVILQ